MGRYAIRSSTHRSKPNLFERAQNAVTAIPQLAYNGVGSRFYPLVALPAGYVAHHLGSPEAATFIWASGAGNAIAHGATDLKEYVSKNKREMQKYGN